MPQFDDPQFRWDDPAPEGGWASSTFPALNRVLSDVGTRRRLIRARIVVPARPEPEPSLIVGGLADLPPRTTP